VLDRVLEHAAAGHGLATPPMPFIELVLTHTRSDAHSIQTNHRRLLPQDHRQVHGGLSIAAPYSTDAAGAGRGEPAPGLPVVRPDQVDADDECSNVHQLRRPGRRSRTGKPHETYRHECLLYRGTSGFIDAALPFVREGLARQEPVLVAVAGDRLAALQTALAADAERVLFADMATLGHNPARIIPAWREFIDRQGSAGCRPVRGIGEPIWATRRPVEIVEAQLHEAMLNLAISPDTPLWLLCPYDSAKLDEQMIDEAMRSHPVVVESNSYRGSTHYGGAHHLEQIFAAPLPEPHSLVTPIDFDPAGHDEVDQVLAFAAAAGLRVDHAVRLTTAIEHLALAADQDNLDVDIRIWADNASVVCEVTDPDMVRDPMIGRGAEPTIRSKSFSVRDRAIRLANELCDLVQIRSSIAGTVVRVWCWQ